MNTLQPERRGSPRRHVEAKARLMLRNQRVVYCIVHNISETGAMFVLREDVALPDWLMLEMGGNLRVARRCQRVWQDGMLCGVKFPDRH